MRDLRGKTAFITGGASGIGFGMARVFAAEGMRIVLADVEPPALAAAVGQLEWAGAEPSGGLGIYCTTKYAVVGLSECLRLDLAPHGIGVSVFCPGFVSTNIHQAGRNRPARFARTEYVPTPEHRELRTAMIKGGIDPLAVGGAVRDAVVANELWVLTHPDLEPFVAEREEGILAAFKQEPDPERVAAIRARAAAVRAANAG